MALYRNIAFAEQVCQQRLVVYISRKASYHAGFFIFYNATVVLNLCSCKKNRTMRNIFLMVISICFMFFSCEKKGYGPTIKAKLVHSSCASDVVQILDASQHHLGQSSWQQSAATPTYNYVFAVSNTCYFKKQGLAIGDEFSFRLTSDADRGCAVCALWDNPPTVSQKIVVTSK